MKKAFTMIEIIIAIVLIGILASVAVKKIHTNTLSSAAKSIINDLRYLQHLALNNDVYNGNENYFQQYWQFYEHCIAKENTNTCGSNKERGYSIFKDSAGNSTKAPSITELARDYLDKNKYIASASSGNNLTVAESAERTNLSKKFGLENLSIFYTYKDSSNTTRVGKTSRLHCNEFGEFILLKEISGQKVIKEPLSIVLRLEKSKTKISSSNTFCIKIEPKTGFISVPEWAESGQKIDKKYCHQIKPI